MCQCFVLLESFEDLISTDSPVQNIVVALFILIFCIIITITIITIITVAAFQARTTGLRSSYNHSQIL